MKYLKYWIILAVLIFGTNAFADVDWERSDHIEHFAVTSASSFMIGEISGEPLAAFVMVNLVGLVKEVAFDDKADITDLEANLLGSTLGATLSFAF